MTTARTLVEKIWRSHVVSELGSGTALLHVDRIFMHDRTGGRMLQGVFDAGLRPACPELVFGTFDHLIDTRPAAPSGRGDGELTDGAREFIRFYRDNAKRAELELIEIADERQGIVHVVAPELGIALPGSTFVCGDSHTCTIGGIGALAWGIGVSQGEHALATQTLRQRWPGTMRVRFDGRLPAGVSAKDMALALIGRHGVAGGAGHAVEFCGPAVRSLDVAARLTLCNLAVEFGAWTGLIAPDDTVFEYLHGRPYSPAGASWDAAVSHWRALASDGDARFDRELSVDCSELAPQVTWGTSPEQVLAVDGRIPDPDLLSDATARNAARRALSYSGLAVGSPIEGVPVEAAFIGSCTNARLDDLRQAAAILRGRRVASGVRALCVPGSTAVKRAAEAEGIDRVFKDAGFEWRESGCSLCFFSGADSFGGATRVITSTNRNFENRQGPGVRSHLASPATVAASAVEGRIADPRKLGECVQ
ncbi:MAG: 3-isopropylmalate dehydratase large subunit [Burkholderiaceae bacterium]